MPRYDYCFSPLYASGLMKHAQPIAVVSQIITYIIALYAHPSHYIIKMYSVRQAKWIVVSRLLRNLKSALNLMKFNAGWMRFPALRAQLHQFFMDHSKHEWRTWSYTGFLNREMHIHWALIQPIFNLAAEFAFDPKSCPQSAEHPLISGWLRLSLYQSIAVQF